MADLKKKDEPSNPINLGLHHSDPTSRDTLASEMPVRFYTIEHTHEGKVFRDCAMTQDAAMKIARRFWLMGFTPVTVHEYLAREIEAERAWEITA